MASKILTETNKLWWFLPAAAAVALLYFLSPILAPFLIAALLVGLRHPGHEYLNSSLYKD